MKKIKMNNIIRGLIVAGILFISVACGSRPGGSSITSDAGMDIIGAGATFPAPLITAMADEYRDITSGQITVNYQSIGSGGGIRQFIEQTIMFGMTEAYLSDEVMAEIEAKTGGKAFNLPVTLADVVATYNLPEVGNGLIFDGQVLAEIFMGRITQWDDPKIAKLNPSLNLPSMPITVVHRSDGSGTTNVFTSFLSAVSDEWKNSIGYSTSVNWPTGVGGNGNEGVAGAVMNSPGAIGYNSLSYALLNGMSYGYIKNSSGNIIEPSFAATTAAADIDLPADTRVLFTNTPAPDGYPIAGFTWMLVYENLEANKAIASREHAEELLRFLIWALTEGQELSEELGYARLPQAAIERNYQMIEQIKWEGEPIGKQLLQEQLQGANI